jgi:hypothetical protein
MLFIKAGGEAEAIRLVVLSRLYLWFINLPVLLQCWTFNNCALITRFWQIIKDDSKRTFEVCDHEMNTNSFTNKTYAMQRVGMNVSCMTPPVTNKNSSKDVIKLTGYTREDGLYERLLKEYREITMKGIDPWEFEGE